MLLSLVPLIDATVSMVDGIDQKSLPLNPEQKIDQSEILRDMRVARKRLGQLQRSLSSKMKSVTELLVDHSSRFRTTTIHLKAVQVRNLAHFDRYNDT